MAVNREVWQYQAIDAHMAGRMDDGTFHLISEYGEGRRGRIKTCPRCHRLVMVGLDAHRAALAATVDPYPLTALGEVEALRDERSTYSLTSGELRRRDRWSIPGHPPAHDLTVLAAHDCTGIPDAWRLPPAPSAPRPVKEDW